MTELGTWIGILCFAGFAAAIITDLIVVAALSRAKQETKRMAEEAGAEISPSSIRGPPTIAAEGQAYCIVFIVVVIIGVLAILLRSVLSEDLVTVFDVSVNGIFAVFLWGITIWSPFYYRAERRRLQRALEAALSKKSV